MNKLLNLICLMGVTAHLYAIPEHTNSYKTQMNGAVVLRDGQIWERGIEVKVLHAVRSGSTAIFKSSSENLTNGLDESQIYLDYPEYGELFRRVKLQLIDDGVKKEGFIRFLAMDKSSVVMKFDGESRLRIVKNAVWRVAHQEATQKSLTAKITFNDARKLSLELRNSDRVFVSIPNSGSGILIPVTDSEATFTTSTLDFLRTLSPNQIFVSSPWTDRYKESLDGAFSIDGLRSKRLINPFTGKFLSYLDDTFDGFKSSNSISSFYHDFQGDAKPFDLMKAYNNHVIYKGRQHEIIGLSFEPSGKGWVLELKDRHGKFLQVAVYENPALQLTTGHLNRKCLAYVKSILEIK